MRGESMNPKNDHHGGRKKKTRISRRYLLQVAGAVAATGLAGCTGVPLGDSGSSGSGGLLSGGSSLNYTQWMYEPGEVRDTDHYRFVYLEPITIDENEEEFQESIFSRFESLESQFSITDIDFDEVDSLLRFGSGSILKASFDRKDVVEELEDADFDDDDEINGYATYYDDNDDRGVAINNNNNNNNTILVARRSGNEDAQDIIELLIETKSGEEPRYADSSDAFSTLSQQLGQTTFVIGSTHEPTEDAAASVDIQYGDTIPNSLEESDQTDREEYGDRYIDSYRFSGEAGDEVEITMESPSGDTFLLLEGPDGSRVAVNDDYADTTNSQIRTTLPTSGEYTIVATSYDERATFEYELTLEAVDTSTNQPAGNFENEVARGSALSVDGDTSTRTWVLVFEETDDVDTDDIEEWVDSDERFEDYDDLNVERNGRAALITGTIDTDDISQLT